MIPWKVKRFVSDHFPLLYHRIANFGIAVNSDEYWDEIYQKEWDSPKRIWPTKNRLLEQKTQKTDSILDIACGTGSILRYLMENGYEELHGTEISDLCVERLTGLGIRVKKSILPKINYPDHSFDVVIASQILEHIIPRRKFLEEVRRVMKPGGQFFLFVPDNCLGPIDELSHVVKFTNKTLGILLGRYFDNVIITSIKDENFTMPILFAHIRKQF